MAVFAGWRYRLRTVLRPRKARAELEEAIRLDLELEAMHRAMHPAMLHADERPATDEASRLAGMVEETWGLPGVRGVMLDVPHVFRLVRATPASTLWILGVASLGIGAIQAVLSVGAVLRTITPAEPQFLQVLHLLIGAAVLLWGMATLVTTRSLVARATGRREMMVARVSAGAAVPDVLRHLRFEALMLAGGAVILAVVVARMATPVFWAIVPDLSLFFGQTISLRWSPWNVVIAATSVIVPGLALELFTARRWFGAAPTVVRADGRWKRSWTKPVLRALTLGFGASAIGIASAFWASARAIVAADIGFPVNGLLVREARCSVGETIAPAGALCLDAASVPMTGGAHEWRRVAGMDGRGVQNVIVLRVVPGYFEMLGVPIVSGRDFETGERATARTVIVSRNLAIALGGVRSIVNERLRVADTMVRVVGVAGDVRHFGAAAGSPFIVYSLDAPRSVNRSAERHLHVWRESGAVAAPDRYAHFIREYHAAYFAPAWVLATFGLVACLLFFFVPDHDERLLLTIGGGIGVSVVATWAMRSLVAPLLYGTQISVATVVWIGTAGGVVAWLAHHLRRKNLIRRRVGGRR